MIHSNYSTPVCGSIPINRKVVCFTWKPIQKLSSLDSCLTHFIVATSQNYLFARKDLNDLLYTSEINKIGC